MGRIQILPDYLIAKIAAGEVIERPAFAVKELVENALDAKTTSIIVHLEDAGLKKISVIDNGEGMDAQDVANCIKPHSTSKIQKEEELIGIKTLGFRGEALASIATISNLLIQSKRAEDLAGTSIEVVAGRIENVSPVGMPTGTSVIVSNLFYPVPARRKFLKSKRTELRLCVDILISYALAYPLIRFSVTQNKKNLFDFPKDDTKENRIKVLLGNTLLQELIPIIYTDGYIQIEGYLAKPQITTTSVSKQHIFINNRKISDRAVALAVKEAYGNLLEPTNYPVFLLFFSMPHETVDVNVHPRKEQVSFMNQQFVYDTVKKAVDDTLRKHNISFHNLRWKEQRFSPSTGKTRSLAGNLLKETVLPWNLQDTIQQTKSTQIQQLHRTYILSQTKQGLIFIDQHAAHERILYEQFLEAFVKEKKSSPMIRLKKPVQLDISLSDMQIMQEYSDALAAIGFIIQKNKKDIYFLIYIPSLFQDRDPKKLLMEILDDLSQEKSIKFIDRQSNKMLAYLACRAAVKAGDSMTQKQCKSLIETLQKTKNYTTCPHGRPTQIIVSLEELHTLFKRT